MAWRIHLKGAFPCLSHYAVSLVPILLRHFQVTLLHLFTGNVQLRVTGSMRRNLGCFRAAQALLFQVLLDLFPSWTRRLDIFSAVAFNLGCAVCARFDLIAQLLQAQSQLGAINRGAVALRTVKLSRLQGAGLAVFALGQIEKDNMRVKLWGGVAVHWPAAVMFKLGGNPVARSFRWMVPADAGLDESLQFVQGHRNSFLVSPAYPLIAAHQGGERDCLRCAEGCVPPGAVLHGANGFAVLVYIFVSGSAANQLLAGNRMLAFAETGKMLRADFGFEAPPLSQPAMPAALHFGTLRVVVVLGIGELFLVIALRLSGAERFGDGQHSSLT